jgi:hydroxymethylbilane synthase
LKALRVGARSTPLSLWQAGHTIKALSARGVAAVMVPLSSSGDRDRDRVSPIEDLPGGAPFADDLEDALRAGEIDVAVHSLKDLAPVPPTDLTIAALLPRGSVTESLVSRRGLTFAELPVGAVIGTSSSRRRAQILMLRPDLVCRTIRGAVGARVDQVMTADLFDAAILATAGLQRLDLASAITETFEARRFVPAAGQGALALQTRTGDRPVCDALQALDHFPTRLATTAERAAERWLEEAGVVAAVTATVHHVSVSVHARALNADGSRVTDGFAFGTEPLAVAQAAVARTLEPLVGAETR